MRNAFLRLYSFSLAVSFIFLSSAVLANTDQKSHNPAYKPVEIRVTNVRDTKFTVSWRTAKFTIGQIRYSETSSIERTAFDDRGQGIASEIHHVTIRNLKPGTVYHYGIVSEGKVYQNSGQPFTITTGPSIIPIGSDVAYGRIYKNKNKPYKDGAIIYLAIRDKDGAGSSGLSGPVSVLSDKNGYWSYELKNFREAGLGDLFVYSEAGDALAIQAQADGLKSAISLEVDTNSDSPARDIMINRYKRGTYD